MRKTLLIPLVSLARPDEDSFLELCIEPATDARADCFHELASGPLRRAVETARRALAALSPGGPAALVYLATADLALSTSAGAALGLALCPCLLRPEWAYQRYIATGTLEFSGSAGVGVGVGVGDSGGLTQKLQAACRLGYQTEPTLLLMPRGLPETEAASLYPALARNNIAVRAVSTLAEAYAVCAGHSNWHQ